MPADLLLEQLYYDAMREGMDFADEMVGESITSILPEDVEQSLRRTARKQAEQLKRMTLESNEARERTAAIVNEWMSLEGATRSIGDLQSALSTEFGPMRALRIARTESATLMNSGIAAKLKSHGWNKIRWVAALDACDECAELDEEVMPIEDFMDHPVKHPNCRCYPEAYDEDEDGEAEEADEGDFEGDDTGPEIDLPDMDEEE